MGLNHSPKIVTNGLRLCVDAANIKSYPGSGSTWNDLSGAGNHGTFVTTPTYNTTNKGSFVFTGNESITFAPSPTLTNQITFEIWLNLSATTPFGIGWIGGREGVYRMLYDATSFSWVCATVNNAWYTTGTVVNSTTSTTAGIYQVVGTYDSVNLRLYVNGVLQTTGAAISGNITSAATILSLFADDSDQTIGSIDPSVGSLYVHRMYNRALSEAEVTQNFNALRGRFGI